MLNSRVDCEEMEYWVTSIPICDSFDDAKGFFHEVKLNKIDGTVTDDSLKTISRLALDADELYTFIKDWYKCCDVKRLLPNWTIKGWYKDYLTGTMQLLEAGRMNFHSVSDFDWFSYHEEFAIGTIKGDIKRLEANKMVDKRVVLLKDKDYTPELSWMVEDYLANRLKGQKSKYKGLIEKVVEENLRNLQFFSNTFNYLDGSLFTLPFRLTMFNNCDKINLEELEPIIADGKGIYLFQSPFMFHNSSTNFIHIKKCLDEYVKVRYENGKTS